LLYKLTDEDDSIFAVILFIYAKTNQSDVSSSLLELLDEELENNED